MIPTFDWSGAWRSWGALFIGRCILLRTGVQFSLFILALIIIAKHRKACEEDVESKGLSC